MSRVLLLLAGGVVGVSTLILGFNGARRVPSPPPSRPAMSRDRHHPVMRLPKPEKADRLLV